MNHFKSHHENLPWVVEKLIFDPKLISRLLLFPFVFALTNKVCIRKVSLNYFKLTEFLIYVVMLCNNKSCQIIQLKQFQISLKVEATCTIFSLGPRQKLKKAFSTIFVNIQCVVASIVCQGYLGNELEDRLSSNTNIGRFRNWITCFFTNGWLFPLTCFTCLLP